MKDLVKIIMSEEEKFTTRERMLAVAGTIGVLLMCGVAELIERC